MSSVFFAALVSKTLRFVYFSVSAPLPPPPKKKKKKGSGGSNKDPVFSFSVSSIFYTLGGQ